MNAAAVHGVSVAAQAPAGRDPKPQSCISNVHWVVCPVSRWSAAASQGGRGVRIDITFTGFARLTCPSPGGAKCALATSASRSEAQTSPGRGRGRRRTEFPSLLSFVVEPSAPHGRRKPAAGRDPKPQSCKSNIHWVVCPVSRWSAAASQGGRGVRIDITFTGCARLTCPSPGGVKCALATSARAW